MLYKAKDKIDKSYDVVVIGSGWGGMTAANRLARNGRKVLLLEAHNKLGGLATWFKRRQGEYIFDVSLHGFPVGMKKTCLKYWNKKIADYIEPIKEVRFINPQFHISTNFTKEDYKRILREKFSIKQENIDGFFRELATMNFYDNIKMTNDELFHKFFPGRMDVIRFLLEPITYANGSTLKDDPAISYGIVFSNFVSKGIYTFKGGTDFLISLLKEQMLQNDMDIKLHAKVDQIIVENSRVTGVVVGEQMIKTRAVVSNSNLKNTIFNLVGEKHFNSDFIEEASQVRLNTSSCQVYMGIRRGETLPYMGDLVFYSEDPVFSAEALLSPKVSSQAFSLYYPDSRPHMEGHYAIVSSSNAKYTDWSNLDETQYKERKNFIEKRALDSIEKIIPGVREKIDFVDSATPRTIQRYTHHLQGASFGTKFEGLEVSKKLHKQIPGLFHSGSVGIIMSGWLGAANYGVIQSHEVDCYLQ
ncbi:MAG: NAD(P)-binding protein [Halobacteriovoraceae bacterium]|nr:NAD(P)-binding protein [Halobacteriovoraceae bacterium]